MLNNDLLEKQDVLNLGEKSITLSSAEETLRHYKKIKLNICSETKEGDKEKMKEFLLKDDNLKIVEELSKGIPKAKAEIEFKFWNELKEEIGEELGAYNFSLDEASSTFNIEEIEDNRKNEWLVTQIFYVYSDYFSGNVLSIGVSTSKSADDFYLFFEMFNKKVEIVDLKNIEEKLLEKFGNLFSKSSYESEYLYRYSDTGFKYDRKTFYKIQDRTEREEIIKQIKEDLLEIGKYIYDNKDEIDEILKEI